MINYKNFCIPLGSEKNIIFFQFVKNRLLRIFSSFSLSENVKCFPTNFNTIKIFNDDSNLLLKFKTLNPSIEIINHILNNPESIIICADTSTGLSIMNSFLNEYLNDISINYFKSSFYLNNLIFIGTRDLSFREKEIIDLLEIQYFNLKNNYEIGISEIMEMALNRSDPCSTKSIHAFLDVNLLSYKKRKDDNLLEAPRLENIFLMGGLLAQTGRLRTMTFIKLNPIIEVQSEIASFVDVLTNFLKTTILEFFEHKELQEISRIKNDLCFFDDVIL